MAKRYVWNIIETVEIFDEENEKATGETKEVEHKVSLVCSNLTGKAIITIDGDEFNISVRPFSLAGTNQMFRLGEMAAVIDFPKKGAPTITADGVTYPSTKA